MLIRTALRVHPAAVGAQ